MRHFRRLKAAAVACTLLALGVTAASAQTSEGTVITNTSTVSYTDANSNTYTPVSASVSVTVGFSGGITFTGVASVAPAAPSTSDTLSFTYTNIGNGNDSLRVTELISNSAVMTVVGYRVGTTAYASLAALNSGLSTTLVAQNGTLVVKVAYNVPAGEGGMTSNYTLTGFSRRDGTKTQAAITAVSPSQTASVAVTPNGSQNLQLLPSNGTNYTFTFAVQNTGNGTDNFSLAGSRTGTAVTIVSVNGVAGSSATLSSLAAGASQNVAVIYSIGAVAAGVKDSVVLTATSTANNTVHGIGRADLTVVKPTLGIAKAAYLDDQTTVVGSTKVVPGQFLQYKITVTNSGTAVASTVSVSDALPAQLTYVSSAPDAAGWTISNASGTVTAALSGTLATSTSRYIWIRVQVK
jgi:uncharacterized repeat protein (TIGR01451 family)